MNAIKLFLPTSTNFINLAVNNGLDDNTNRSLNIFKKLNFLGLLTGIVMPIAVAFEDGSLSTIAWIVACLPALISACVLVLHYFKNHEAAMLVYFTMYPLTTALVYVGSVDAGIELLFILYCVFSVFFLQNIRLVILAFSFSTICYISVFVVKRDYAFILSHIGIVLYIINHLLAILFIFIGLFLIKKENTIFHKKVLLKNEKLKTIFAKIQHQKEDMKLQALKLQQQTLELMELNSIKDKLFSIISHDLRTPIYSLRNLFRNMEKYDLPATEIKLLLPDIVQDLNYTTTLMENLLQWAKSQMSGANVSMELIDVETLLDEVKNLLRLQANSKKIYLSSKMDEPIYIYADKNMMNLVLRNLVSNAIKFTPETGEICIGAKQTADKIELFVKDTGMGISKESISKLFGDEFYTTKGTSNEAGTGLGLILCKDFIQKNGGNISVTSDLGKGTTITCELPIP